MTKKQVRPRQVTLYNGLPGDKGIKVLCRDATRSVYINGKLEHALEGLKGMTFGCGLSRMISDPDNVAAFKRCGISHVGNAYVTRSRAYVVTKEQTINTGKEGERRVPLEVIAFEHKYPWVIDMNDSGSLKSYAKRFPEVLEQQFILQPIHESKHSSIKHPKRNVPDAQRRRAVQLGEPLLCAYARAVAAGYISRNAVASVRRQAKNAARRRSRAS